MSKCSRCQTSIEEDASYCPKCGKRIKRGHSDQSNQAKSDVTDTATKNKDRHQMDLDQSEQTGRMPHQRMKQTATTAEQQSGDYGTGIVQSYVTGLRGLLRSPVLLGAFIITGISLLSNNIFDAYFEGRELILLNTTAGVVTILLGILSTGVSYSYAARRAQGGTFENSVAEFVSTATQIGSQFGQLFVLAVIYTATVILGLSLFIIPGIYLAGRLALAFPACVLNEQGTFRSLLTSWNYTRGSVLGIVGILLLSFTLMFGSIFATLLLGLIVGEAVLVPLEPLVVLLIICLFGAVQLSVGHVYLRYRSDSTDIHPENEYSV